MVELVQCGYIGKKKIYNKKWKSRCSVGTIFVKKNYNKKITIKQNAKKKKKSQN